jgi:hypothetical protein
MALDSYSGLSTAINTWNERSYSQAQADEFILIFEAAANRKLRQDFRRRSTGTLVTDDTGLATLPSGFVGMSSLTRDVVGSMPLKQVSWDALIQRNPYEIASDAEVYAINGMSLMVAPVVEDSFNIAYSAVLAGLSATNTTNWLLALAPDAYLFGCKAAAYAFEEDMNNAATFGAQASAIIDELVSHGNVAEYGNAEMTFELAVP